MRKYTLALLLAAALSVPAHAQDADGVCNTSEAVLARAADLGMPTFYTLHGVDIGDEDKAEVVIFEVDQDFLAVAFEGGCYAGYQALDKSGVEKLINENTKKI